MSDPVKKGQKYQNREAFVAHRNIKRAVRDVDAEAALKGKACAGVCRRCAQKARPPTLSPPRGRALTQQPPTRRLTHARTQSRTVLPAQVVWRFKYGKYKAMRAGRAGNCTACRLKRVHLAYRVLCDHCARSSKLCPGCNKPPALAELAEGEGAPEEGEEEEGDESSEDEELAELEAAGVVITR